MRVSVASFALSVRIFTTKGDVQSEKNDGLKCMTFLCDINERIRHTAQRDTIDGGDIGVREYCAAKTIHRIH